MLQKSKYLLLTGLLFSFIITKAYDGKYIYTIDLTHVVNDKVYIELEVPTLEGKDVTFYLPKMIPGTYAIEDYGRFVSDLKAVDKKGRTLKVEKTGANSWKIMKANKLVKITYWIDNSYDGDIDGPDIFQPAGTNIEAGKNFILNASGYFGYFEDKSNYLYEVKVIKPAGFYGSTGLIPQVSNKDISAGDSLADRQFEPGTKVDVFATNNYDELVDSPIMYCVPDTTLIDVSGTQVLVSVYSPNDLITSKQIANTIDEVLMAQKDYLGGKLPVDKYAFLFYFTDEPVMSYGALEHSYSSFYYMPEYSIDDMQQQLRDFAAHEFFHIVTPLSIHSEEIVPFNFTNPKMSRHLWLYEGMTEYFAGNAQVKARLITIDQYINMLREKMMVASEFNDTLPMTTLSLGVLDTYADQYYNVYQKGALIGLALDLTLLDLSDGKYGVQNMMADLSKEYGKHKSFKDNELFDKIVDLTYPEIKEFFNRYVDGNEPLPMAEIFEKAGLIYEKEGLFYDYSIGLTNDNIGVVMDRNVLYIKNEDKLDNFGKLLGLHDGDVITAINGEPFPELGPQVQSYIINIMSSMQEGKEFTMKILRPQEDGSEKEMTLRTKTVKVARQAPYTIRPMEQPSPHQILVRNAWLGLNKLLKRVIR